MCYGQPIIGIGHDIEPLDIIFLTHLYSLQNRTILIVRDQLLKISSTKTFKDNVDSQWIVKIELIELTTVNGFNLLFILLCCPLELQILKPP